MIRYMAVLFFVCMAGHAYSSPACDELGTQGGGGKSEESFWGPLFGGASSVSDSNCEAVDSLDDKSATEPGIYSDSDEAIRSLIAEGRIQLENTLEEYKGKTGEEMIVLGQDISALEKETVDLKESLKSISLSNERKLSALSKGQLSSVELIQSNNKDIKLLIEGLSERLDKVSSSLEKSENKLAKKVENNRQEAINSVAELDRLVSENVLYLVISIAVVLLVFSSIFYFLRKKIFDQSADLTGGLIDTRKSLEEEFVKIDSKLVEIFEAQMQSAKSEPVPVDADVDHGLVIKIADEIVRIQKNITRMDEKTKGLKQLAASVTRIQDNVASNGYEIVEMLGMQYREGMKVSANFLPDEELEEGEQIITRVIKPQINYQGTMIQAAQIEVSQGE